MSDFKDQFPDVPKYSATWAPIYLEPIIGSGEKITIGIAATDKTGEFKVIPTLNQESIKCILGPHSDALLNIVEASIFSIETCLEKHQAIQTWIPPFSGLTLGKHKEMAGTDMMSIIKIATSMTSAFSNIHDVIQDDIGAHMAIDEKDRWPVLVKDAVVRINSNFTHFFNKSFQIKDGARPTTIDFLGNRLAVNLGKLQPGSNLSAQINTAKSKLWNLSSLREYEGQGMFNNHRQAYELILWKPDDDDPAYSDKQIHNIKEALLELVDEGVRHSLCVTPVTKPDDAAQRIINAEAA